MSETKSGNKLILIPLALLAAMLLLVALDLLFALNWSYSKGERVGYIQKFSNKGWVCKTWEGELAIFPVQMMQAEKFVFTVRDDAVANKINQGLGKKVAIVYEEHKGVPSTCFGETSYYVVDVRILE